MHPKTNIHKELIEENIDQFDFINIVKFYNITHSKIKGYIENQKKKLQDM